MLAVPEEDAVKVKLQVAVPDDAPAERVQLPDELRVPVAVPEAEKLTAPVGVVTAPDPVSVTLAMQLEA